MKEGIMNKRIILEIAMLGVILSLINYRYVGNWGHESLAAVFFCLFLIHTWFNRRWYSSLFRGRWNKMRILTAAVDFFLIASFISVIGIGIFISKQVPVLSEGMRWLHPVHKAAGYSMLIALGLHVGLHWQLMLPKIKKLLPKIPDFLMKAAALLLVAGGAYYSDLFSIGSRLLMLSVPKNPNLPSGYFPFVFAHFLILSMYGVIAYYFQKMLKKL